jgi:Leucine-rich repeat (LRR) protein
LVNTTKLQLCCNNLKEIPAEIGYMKNLTSLSLAKNKITFLPESIGLLAKLTDLKLSRNLLSTLPASIKNLTNLVSLKMARNNFTSLPSELGLLSALICLDLSHNKLTSIPVEVGRLKYLKSLKVDDVSFSHPGFINPVPEMATLSSFPTLKELAARLVVLHQIPIWQHTDQCLKEYLLSSHSCSFCQGPYFDSHVKRIRVVSRNEFGIPMEDRLCIDHWKTDLERLKLMFCAKPKNVFTAVPQPESNSKKIRRFSKLASTNSFDSITTIPLSSIDSSPTLPKLPESIITHKGLFGFYKKKKTDNCADVPMNAVRSEQM